MTWNNFTASGRFTDPEGNEYSVSELKVFTYEEMLPKLYLASKKLNLDEEDLNFSDVSWENFLTPQAEDMSCQNIERYKLLLLTFSTFLNAALK